MVKAATLTAVSASISTPVAACVATLDSIATPPGVRRTCTSTWVSGSGWQSGISPAVCLAAAIPATRAISSGFPLGFWFANQGSEVIFVIMIFVYCAFLNRLDKKYDVHED